MLNKQAPETRSMANDDMNYNERPPPFNPEARIPSSLSGGTAASFATDTNDHMLHHHSSEHPPPYYDPHLDETVIWDENLSPERDNTRRNTHADIPTTPRGEDGQYVPSPTVHSSPTRMYWQSTQKAAKRSWNKMKRFEEKHEITNKTKQGAKSLFKSTKRATITASRKVQEFDEKHQVVHKSKQSLVNGTHYITNKCRRHPTM